MTKLIHREGDIFDTDALAIGEGVNTQGFMGAGIATQFRARFPAMYEDYKRVCRSGTFKGGNVAAWELEDGRMIYNIASQELPGANATYDFLFEGVYWAMIDCEERGIDTLALPRIASGIGGLDEGKVEGILWTLALLLKTDIELWTYKA